jgi:hypothetical protein
MCASNMHDVHSNCNSRVAQVHVSCASVCAHYVLVGVLFVGYSKAVVAEEYVGSLLCGDPEGPTTRPLRFSPETRDTVSPR